MDTDRPWVVLTYSIRAETANNVDPVGSTPPCDVTVIFNPNAVCSRDMLTKALGRCLFEAVAAGLVD